MGLVGTSVRGGLRLAGQCAGVHVNESCRNINLWIGGLIGRKMMIKRESAGILVREIEERMGERRWQRGCF